MARKIWILLALLLALTITCCAAALATDIILDNTDGPWTLNDPGNTYKITSDVTVPDDTTLKIEANCELIIESNGTLTFASGSGSLINDGTLTLSGGTLSLWRTITSDSDGIITCNGNSTIIGVGYVLYILGTMTNNGTLTCSSGLIPSLGGELINRGTLTSSGIIYNHNDSTLTNSGTLICSGNIYNHGTLTNNGTLTSSGTFTNESGGTIDGNNPIDITGIDNTIYSITVTFDLNGGQISGVPDDIDKQMAGKATENAAAAISDGDNLRPIKPGHTFTGWAIIGQGSPAPLSSIMKIMDDITLTAQYTLTPSTPSTPAKPTPVLTGQNSIEGTEDGFADEPISLSLSGATFGDPIDVKLSISGLTFEGAATTNGDFTLTVPKSILNQLREGEYDIAAYTAANADNSSSALATVGKVTVNPYVETTWTVPAAFKATRGFSYALVTSVPAHRPLPALAMSMPAKYGSIATDGIITILPAAKLKSFTLTVKEGDIEKRCKVTVVGNNYVKAKPIGTDKSRIFTSTKKIRYLGDVLKGEVHILSNKASAISTVRNRKLQIWDGNNLLFQKDMKNVAFTRPLRKNQYTYKTFTLNAKEMEIIKEKTGLDRLDLAKGKYDAVMTGIANNGTVLTPMKRTTKEIKTYSKAVYTNIIDTEE